jgi:hypothetical protein
LTGGHDNEHTVDWYQAKRITYELQDIADITLTGDFERCDCSAPTRR